MGACVPIRALAIRRSKLLRDPLGPRVDVRPLAVVAPVPAEGFEQEPPPCGPVIKINDSRKDAIVAVASGEVVADTHHAVAGALTTTERRQSIVDG